MHDVFDTGHLRLFAVGRVQVHLHWSFAVMVGIFGVLSWVHAAGVCTVLLTHAIAQLLVTQELGGQVRRCVLTGIGGRAQRQATVGAQALGVIAWSGVTAQVFLVAAWLVVRWVFSLKLQPWVGAVDDGLIYANLCLVVLNLLPLPNTDGQAAWSAWTTTPPPAPPRHTWPTRLSPEELARQAETERIFRKMLDELLPPITDHSRDED